MTMFKKEVNLTAHSNYQIGGPARFFYVAKNADQITKALDKWRKEEILMCPSHRVLPRHSHTFVLGGGTNLLISDEGFDGLVLKPEIETLKSDGTLVRVGAGVSVSQLLNYLISKSLSGLEWAGGLPGTVGGAIRGNAGAFGGEIKDCVREVVSLDISGKIPKSVKRNNKQCQFDYRDSIFKRRDGGEIILEATLMLKKGDKKTIQSAMEEKIKYRQERQPLDYPNIGSIFKNVPLSRISTNKDPNTHEYYIRVNSGRGDSRKLVMPVKNDPFPVVPTAYLIDQVGLKGVTCGGAMISPKHPNFIVNVLDAKAEDVKKLIRLAKSSIKEKFGIELEEEIQYVE